MREHIKLSCLIVLGCMVFISSVHAQIFNFEIFTDNGAYNDDPGVDISMDVYNGGNTAKFTFYNDSTVDCTITRLYFDDGTLIGSTLNVLNGPGTLFSEGVPGANNLPSGNDIGFVADREFTIGAESPSPANGINIIDPGEWVTIEFDLIGGTLQDVLDELYSGDLRVGLHVMSFQDGSSESAVNTPEPATMCLLALGGLALRKRKK